MDKIVVVSGTEDFLVNAHINDIKSKINNIEFNFSTFSEIDDATIIEACHQVPFMNDYRVVLVYGDLFKGQHELLLEYFKAPSPTTSLIIVTAFDKRTKLYKSIEKHVKFCVFNKLSIGELKIFISDYFTSKGKLIDDELIKLIIDRIGYLSIDTIFLYNVISELERLVNMSSEKEISRDIIETMKPPAETNVFKLVGKISKKSPEAVKYLQGLLNEGTNEMQLLGLLLWHYRLLYKVKIAGASAVEVNEYSLKDLDMQLDIATVKMIIGEIMNTQNNIKSGLINSRLALEIVVAMLVNR